MIFYHNAIANLNLMTPDRQIIPFRNHSFQTSNPALIAAIKKSDDFAKGLIVSLTADELKERLAPKPSVPAAAPAFHASSVLRLYRNPINCQCCTCGEYLYDAASLKAHFIVKHGLDAYKAVAKLDHPNGVRYFDDPEADKIALENGINLSAPEEIETPFDDMAKPSTKKRRKVK